MSILQIICPCGIKGKLYKECCYLVHTNIHNAQTAQDLMCSRYSAFVLCIGDYLVLSHSMRYRNDLNMQNTIRWSRSVAWNRLEIISIQHGSISDTEGTVEFKAYFKEKNKLKCIHEKSMFIRENNHWVYLDEL